MSNIIPIKTINSPAMASAFGYQADDLTDGASVGFPVLSYRGKVWRVSSKGETTTLTTPDGDPLPSVRVIILKANANLSKQYYEKSYTEGDSESPDCSSNDGIRPDASVANPQSKTCAACPMAAWGSRISDDGKEMKACHDSRRIAVVPCNDLRNEAFGGPMLLRIPAASLGNLVAYDNMLKKANAAYFGVATKISFDMEAAYPKLVFEYDADNTAKLEPAAGETILELRGGEEVKRVLSVTQETGDSGGESTPPTPSPKAPAVAPPPVVEVPEAPAPAPAPAPEAAAPVTQPVEPETPAPTDMGDTSSGATNGEVVSPSAADVDSIVAGILND